VKEQSRPVKVTLLMKSKSGRSLALYHCTFRMQKENAWQQKKDRWEIIRGKQWQATEWPSILS